MPSWCRSRLRARNCFARSSRCYLRAGLFPPTEARLASESASCATQAREPASRFSVILPFAFHRFGHTFASRPQPIRFSAAHVLKNALKLSLCAQVDVCRFRTHGIEEPFLIAFRGKIIHVDWIGVWREPPDQPISDHFLEGIGRADRRAHYHGIVGLPISVPAVEPHACRRQQGFCLPCDKSPSPFGQGDKSLLSQAPQTSLSPNHLIAKISSGHRLPQRIHCAARQTMIRRRKRIQFVPERTRRFDLVKPQFLNLCLLFRKNDRAAFFMETLPVSHQDRFAGIFELQLHVPGVNRNSYAGGQPNEIIRIRQREGFIEIVHSPAKPPLRITPSSKAIHMQIAHSQNLRSTTQIGAYLRPKLHPTVKRAAEKTRQVLSHPLMLVPELGFNYRRTAAHPMLVCVRGFFDVHQTLSQTGSHLYVRRLKGATGGPSLPGSSVTSWSAFVWQLSRLASPMPSA